MKWSKNKLKLIIAFIKVFEFCYLKLVASMCDLYCPSMSVLYAGESSGLVVILEKNLMGGELFLLRN